MEIITPRAYYETLDAIITECGIRQPNQERDKIDVLSVARAMVRTIVNIELNASIMAASVRTMQDVYPRTLQINIPDFWKIETTYPGIFYSILNSIGPTEDLCEYFDTVRRDEVVTMLESAGWVIDVQSVMGGGRFTVISPEPFPGLLAPHSSKSA